MLSELGLAGRDQELFELLFLKVEWRGVFLLKHFAYANAFFEQFSQYSHTFAAVFGPQRGCQNYGMNVEKNISQLTRSLPAGCRLVAVSKTHGVDKIMAAYNAGQRIFGENRVQEMVEKQPQLPADIDWHLIGHLQRNKVKYIADFVALIHSVDSIKLLQEINRQGERVSRVIPCLIQVHIAREETKFGFSAEEIPTVITSEEIAGFRFVEIRGLMGMATLTDDTDQIRREFRGLRELFDRVKTMKTPPNVRFTELSMGMSSDYQIAIEEGSTLVRIGSAIFGERS